MYTLQPGPQNRESPGRRPKHPQTNRRGVLIDPTNADMCPN